MKTAIACFAFALIVLAPAAEAAGQMEQKVTLLRTPAGGIQPQAVTDSQGTIHLIYYKGEGEGGDIFYTRRAVGQMGFTKPIRVNTEPHSAMAIGTIRGAQLALGRNGRVHVAWNGHAAKGRSYLEAPMLYTRLNDSGTGFEPERNLITVARGLDGGGSVAADEDGNVYVMWHAPIPGQTSEEAVRAVFLAKSTDDGKSFLPERQIISNETGVCGCCGMKSFADKHGNLLALYRGASNLTNRDETAVLSRDGGRSFQIAYTHGWTSGVCPMSSAFASESPAGILAAAETDGMVYYVRIDSASGGVSFPVPPKTKGKYPVVVSNADGLVLLAWTEGTAWAKGGSIAWQIYDGRGGPIARRGYADGLPAWSLVAATAEPDGNFVIIY